MLAAAKPLKIADFAAEPSAKNREDKPLEQAVAAPTNLDQLFEAHHARVFRAAYRITGSAADAEDVLQTVFLRLARGAENFTTPENPESYFARAAVNASLDLLRARKRSQTVAVDDFEGSQFAGDERNPETTQADRELRDLIRAAVGRLGPTAGQMFALRYFEGDDNGEIARIMNTSPLVVGVTLHRARTRLKKEIGSYLQKHK